MNDLLQTIMGAQGGGAVQNLAKSFGLDESQAGSAIQALLPALAGGIKRNAAQPGGLESLLGALNGGNHARYLDQPDTLGSASTIQDGIGILSHVLGSKDVSRAAASRASQQTGIGADLLKKMLPVVATMAMGALSKQTASNSAFSSARAGAAPSGDLLGALGPLLDADGDGSAVDDIFNIAKKFF